MAAVEDGEQVVLACSPLVVVLQVLVGGLGDGVLLGSWTLEPLHTSSVNLQCNDWISKEMSWDSSMLYWTV